jgi:hypothetical protein
MIDRLSNQSPDDTYVCLGTKDIVRASVFSDATLGVLCYNSDIDIIWLAQLT